ncbi:MAG: C25 family cysteine peptidase [Thermoplasmatota archaeon]
MSKNILKTRKKIKIKNTVLFIFLILILSSASLTQGYHQQSEQQIMLNYSFKQPKIQSINILEDRYDRIFLEDCVTAGNPGEPNIPSKGAYILLPPNSKIDNIEITTGKKHNLGYNFKIDPVEKSLPMTSSSVSQKIFKNMEIYNANKFYPDKLYTEVGIYYFRGYKILVLLLHPIQYNPVTGELFFYENMYVNIKTSSDSLLNNLFRGTEKDEKEILKKVDNPNIASQYINKIKPLYKTTDSYDLLILTTDSLKSGFEPLKQAHDVTGISTVIKTLSDVGASDLESIRNYIKQAYINWGIEYVLIGGDSNIIPAPILWVSGMDENVTYYEEYMPSDIYYACLDGPFNYDGDNKWGEPTDGENGGDVDLIAEVYVGRACVDNLADVNNFVTKTITYINKDPDDEYLKKVCLAAEYLGNYGIASYGGTYLDQLINTCTDDGYTTIGIPDDEYNITKLYDSPSYKWDYSEIMSIINNDVHIINHLGHSSYRYNMKMYISDVNYLTNDKPCFIYSQGCMAGGFDNPEGYDCIAEQFTVKTSHGAFAGIWNARYGFFWSYSTDGDSQRFHRQFWDAVFGENITQIGKANHDSKEDNLPIIGSSCIRWVYYETNLFGDPSLSFFETPEPPNNPPDKPSITGPNSGKPKVEYEFTIVTTDPDGNNVYYYVDWGDGNNTNWTGHYTSGQEIKLKHTWLKPEVYTIKVKAKDIFNQESEYATLEINLPRSRILTNLFFLKILQDILHRFSIIEKIINIV